MSKFVCRAVNRRRVLAAAAGAVALGAGTGQQGLAAETNPDFLFVQSAAGMTFDAAAGRLTLTGVSPITIFFSDRPERIAGNMRTADFVPFWSEGTDSFLSDPPNADISILEGNTLLQTIVVLRDPEISGADLSYTVDVLEGELPSSGKDVSVFIDVIGMPLTPLSYAGARRRVYRRAVLYR